MDQTKDCKHTNAWEWRKRSYTVRVPASSVYCPDCNTLLFSVVFDPDIKTISLIIPSFHTIQWHEYIMNIFKEIFPKYRVVFEGELK